MSRTYEDVTRYVEDQSQGKCKVLSAKTEHKNYIVNVTGKVSKTNSNG